MAKLMNDVLKSSNEVSAPEGVLQGAQPGRGHHACGEPLA